MKSVKSSAKKSVISTAQTFFGYFHNYIQSLNNSKIFAGIMIITLNIASKFVNIKLGKTLEAYLKYSFSKQILVFAIAWMGTRDIYIAFFISTCFIIITEYLLHEDSSFFIMSPEFRDYHISKMENMETSRVSDEDVKKAMEVLVKAEIQKKQGEVVGTSSTGGEQHNHSNTQPHTTPYT